MSINLRTRQFVRSIMVLLFALLVIFSVQQIVSAHSVAPAQAALVAQTETVIPTSLIELFKLFFSPIFVGPIISFLLERVPYFQQLESDSKAIVAFVVVIAFALLGYALINFTPTALIAALDPVWAQIAFALTAFLASQWYHLKVQKKPDPGLVVNLDATAYQTVDKKWDKA